MAGAFGSIKGATVLNTYFLACECIIGRIMVGASVGLVLLIIGLLIKVKNGRSRNALGSHRAGSDRGPDVSLLGARSGVVHEPRQAADSGDEPPPYRLENVAILALLLPESGMDIPALLTDLGPWFAAVIGVLLGASLVIMAAYNVAVHCRHWFSGR